MCIDLTNLGQSAFARHLNSRHRIRRLIVVLIVAVFLVCSPYYFVHRPGLAELDAQSSNASTDQLSTSKEVENSRKTVVRTNVNGPIDVLNISLQLQYQVVETSSTSVEPNHETLNVVPSVETTVSPAPAVPLLLTTDTSKLNSEQQLYMIQHWDIFGLDYAKVEIPMRVVYGALMKILTSTLLLTFSYFIIKRILEARRTHNALLGRPNFINEACKSTGGEQHARDACQKKKTIQVYGLKCGRNKNRMQTTAAKSIPLDGIDEKAVNEKVDGDRMTGERLQLCAEGRDRIDDRNEGEVVKSKSQIDSLSSGQENDSRNRRTEAHFTGIDREPQLDLSSSLQPLISTSPSFLTNPSCPPSRDQVVITSDHSSSLPSSPAPESPISSDPTEIPVLISRSQCASSFDRNPENETYPTDLSQMPPHLSAKGNGATCTTISNALPTETKFSREPNFLTIGLRNNNAASCRTSLETPESTRSITPIVKSRSQSPNPITISSKARPSKVQINHKICASNSTQSIPKTLTPIFQRAISINSASSTERHRTRGRAIGNERSGTERQNGHRRGKGFSMRTTYMLLFVVITQVANLLPHGYVSP